MKLDCWNYAADNLEWNTILAIKCFHSRKVFEWGSLGPGLRHGFTGNYYSILQIEIILFGKQLGASMAYNEGSMSRELAKKEYHARHKDRI